MLSGKKKSQHKKKYTVRFYLYKVQNEVKLIYRATDEDGGPTEEDAAKTGGHRDGLCGSSVALFHNLDGWLQMWVTL